MMRSLAIACALTTWATVALAAPTIVPYACYLTDADGAPYEGTVDVRTAIYGCATEAEERGLQASKDYTQFTYDGLREGGMNVEPASEELMSGLREVGETMTQEWLEAAGEDGQAIVDDYKAMQ